jgi:hypothetical protein
MSNGMKKSRVTVRNPLDTHLACSVEVIADSLNEAVIRGEAAIRRQATFMRASLPNGSKFEVTVCEPEVTYEIELTKVHDWLNCSGRTPREQGLKADLRKLFTDARAD